MGFLEKQLSVVPLDDELGADFPRNEGEED